MVYSTMPRNWRIRSQINRFHARKFKQWNGLQQDLILAQYNICSPSVNLNMWAQPQLNPTQEILYVQEVVTDFI